jgi:peptidoglycan/LPS O-acetylase OafA/YrhL
MTPTPHPPHWYAIPARVLLVTFIGTLVAFAVSLLVGILGTLVMSSLRHVPPDMTAAYRHVAVPVAGIAGCIICVLTLAMEIRQYRQSKTLATLARIS